jgi:eukaryotic-like serine/threonine-protein kinase
LGKGGQGTVYLVEAPHGAQALKWYNTLQATAEQCEAIRTLAQAGPPWGPVGRRFIWPLDLVTAPDTTQFGHLMPLIDTQRFATLNEVQARLKPTPSYPTLCEISAQTANSYRALHLRGYCYRDIAAGNLMFDPHTGDVLICDNDNIGIKRTVPLRVRPVVPTISGSLVCRPLPAGIALCLSHCLPNLSVIVPVEARIQCY